MAVALVVLAATTYLLLKQNLIHRADATAVELADAFLTTVNAEMSDLPNADGIQQAISAAISEHRFQDVTFIVLDAHGDLLGMSDGHAGFEHETGLSWDDVARTLLMAPLNSRTFQLTRVHGHTYRKYVRPFNAQQQEATLIVLQSLRRQNELLETLAETFGIVVPLTLLLAACGGYLLARRSLLPVVAMSRQASHIGAESLHERLLVKNPRDELGKLAASFNELLDRVSRSFDRQKRFFADASHELRTPVAILCGETDVTLSQPERTQQEYRDSLSIVGEEARRLKHIVDDLFTLARADAGQYPVELSDFYLEELAAECCRNMRSLAAARQIKTSCEMKGELPIHADETLIRRMLLNLLDNAIKYTATGGNVHVRGVSENGNYCLNIEDSGPGIPGDLQPRIFERFFRVDKARSRSESDGGGAGLGLSIASWIAEVHGGRIELTRSSPEGSVFTVHLPQNNRGR
jgi:two-component system, OmpR family, sensor kinase